MTLTIKCLYCDGTGSVLCHAIAGRPTMTCPSCYGVATQRVRVLHISDVDARSIVSMHA